jgi:regulator of cell morphogenesis and NO signaling
MSAEKKPLAEKTLGQLVTEDCRRADIFEKHGMDFCCGGAVTLAEACRKNNLDLDKVVEEMEQLEREPTPRGENYAAWDLSFLADYIVNTHHAWLHENTEKIVGYAHKIVEVHGSRHAELKEVAAHFDRIAADLKGHLQKEEDHFSPAIKRLEAASKVGDSPDDSDRRTVEKDLDQLFREHQEVGDAVHEIRHLTKDYAVPQDACNTYALTYRLLKEFEDDLHKHVHLENNILFPKASALLQQS